MYVSEKKPLRARNCLNTSKTSSHGVGRRRKSFSKSNLRVKSMSSIKMIDRWWRWIEPEFVIECDLTLKISVHHYSSTKISPDDLWWLQVGVSQKFLTFGIVSSAQIHESRLEQVLWYGRNQFWAPLSVFIFLSNGWMRLKLLILKFVNKRIVHPIAYKLVQLENRICDVFLFHCLCRRQVCETFMVYVMNDSTLIPTGPCGLSQFPEIYARHLEVP